MTPEYRMCKQSLACHESHVRYFMEAGAPHCAAVYERAIARVTHFMNNPPEMKYVEKKVYQPLVRGHYASRKRA